MTKISKSALVLAMAAIAFVPVRSEAADDPITVVRSGTAPAKAGSPETFTGDVSIRILSEPKAPGRASVGLVEFQPGARTFWHTHPAGQSLVVTQGCGWVLREGEPAARICAGDTVHIPPGTRHWHGATASSGMSHLAITEALDGRNADWLGPVSDAEYQGPGAAK